MLSRLLYVVCPFDIDDDWNTDDYYDVDDDNDCDVVAAQVHFRPRLIMIMTIITTTTSTTTMMVMMMMMICVFCRCFIIVINIIVDWC